MFNIEKKCKLRRMVRSFLRKVILLILPDTIQFRALAYWPKLETWRKQHVDTCPVFESRMPMYDYIKSEVLHDKPIHYLEFGVFKGESIKYFAGLNSNVDSKFIGFDTFTGLPEDWVQLTGTVGATTFDVGGELPKINDARVSFQKGLFQDTLPGFLEDYNSTNQLVIHNDSDLYSATLYVLTSANDIIVPGTIIIFDEFYCVMHEFRALEDYCASYMRSYEVIASTHQLQQIAIRIL